MFSSALCLQEKNSCWSLEMLCSLKYGVRLPVPPDGRLKGLKLSLTRIPLGTCPHTHPSARQAMPPPPQPPQQSPGPAESPSAPSPGHRDSVGAQSCLPSATMAIMHSPNAASAHLPPDLSPFPSTLEKSKHLCYFCWFPSWPQQHPLLPPSLLPCYRGPRVSLPLTVPESILCSRSRLCEGMLLWKHLRPHGLRCAY